MIDGVLGVAVDVTRRVRAEAALKSIEAGLSPTERKVLQLLARSDLKSNREIGEVLCLSGDTVRWHTQRIARKLGVPAPRAVVVAAARERGLLAPAT